MRVVCVILFGICLSQSSSEDNMSLLTRAKVYNGEPAERGQFPWQAAIISVGTDFLHFCSGAIINKDWILTAGYCIYGANSTRLYTGALTTTAATVTDISIQIVHEHFDRETLKNDIAIIKVERSLQFDDYTKPIALATEELEAGAEVVVSGWGAFLTNDTSRSTELNYIRVNTISNTRCEEVYGSNVITSSVVCTSADDPVKSPCLGDTGDPVVINLETNPVHVAIFSFLSTFGCGQSYPAGYTRTAHFRNWIREHTGV